MQDIMVSQAYMNYAFISERKISNSDLFHYNFIFYKEVFDDQSERGS